MRLVIAEKLLAEADGKAEFRLEFGDTHDAG